MDLHSERVDLQYSKLLFSNRYIVERIMAKAVKDITDVLTAIVTNALLATVNAPNIAKVTM